MSVPATPGTTRVDPPAGSTLVGLKFHQFGMMMFPYYSIRQLGDDFQCAQTSSELYWAPMDSAETLEYLTHSSEGYAYDEYAGGDPLATSARYSSALVSADALSELSDQLAAAGAYGWDGFHKVRTPPPGLEVLDGGDGFDLALLLSDGSHVRAHGQESYPPGYDLMVEALRDFFDRHVNWSE